MPRPFTDTLGALRFGTLNDDLSKALHELVNACSSTGKVGDLKLTIKLKPARVA